MNAQNEPDFQDEVWQRIRKVIAEIVEKSADGDYIYRGERECYAKHNRSGTCENCGKCDCCGQLDCCKKRERLNEDTCHGKVSSGLYRDLPQYGQSGVEDVDLSAAERAILDEVRGYTTRTNKFEILTELQHFGGKTNLIDFTTDYLIALFFACDGAYEEDGRVVLLQNKSKTYEVREPPRTVPRGEFQRSVFVQPRKGYVEPDRGKVITLPANLKTDMLEYLKKHHSISVKTVYNDLHGFIERSAPMEVRRGSRFVTKGRQKDNPRKQVNCYAKAIEHYEEAIRINPEWLYAYYNRGVAHVLEAQAYRRLAMQNSQDSLCADDRINAALKAAIESYNRVIEAKSSKPQREDFLARAYNGRGAAYSLSGKFCQAISNYDTAIKLDRGYASAYCNRGETWLHLKNWPKAKADLTKAKDLGRDLVASFQRDYASVEEFEQENNVDLPMDIKKMLRKPRRG